MYLHIMFSETYDVIRKYCFKYSNFKAHNKNTCQSHLEPATEQEAEITEH